MKKQGKFLAIAAVTAACVAMAVGLTACSGGETASVKEVYTTNGTLTESGGEYDIKMTGSTTVTLYTDGTYELIVASYGFMGAYGNSQVMQSAVVSIGTYTYTASADDEEVATVVLSAPTRIISSSVTGGTIGAVYLDTSDESTFTDSDTTAAEYLSANGKSYTLTVNTASKSVTSGLE